MIWKGVLFGERMDLSYSKESIFHLLYFMLCDDYLRSHSMENISFSFSGQKSNNFKMQFVVMIRSILKNAQTFEVSLNKIIF
jgi:hypothetical protein